MDSTKIIIEQLHFKSTVLIKAWPDSLNEANGILSDHLKTKKLPDVGRFFQYGELYYAALSPGQYMVFSNDDNLYLKLKALFSEGSAVVVDISHSRCGLRVSGQNVEKLLNKRLAINLDDAALPTGSAIQSSIHSIGVIVFKMTSDDYTIFSYSSLSQSLLKWVIDSSLEYGYAFS